MGLLLTAAVYVLSSVMAYDFFELLRHIVQVTEGVELEPESKMEIALKAAIWPYYLVKMRFFTRDPEGE
jgi:hypothetical protein